MIQNANPLIKCPTSHGAPTGINAPVSFQHPFNRAGGRTSDVLQEMNALIVVLLLFSPIAQAQSRMGPYVPVPKITVDLESLEGLTDNPNIRCTGELAADGNVVVELKAKKEFIVNGINLTISDGSGVVVSALLAPQPSGEWMSYCFTVRRASLDRAWIDVYGPRQSGRISLKGLPLQSKKQNGEQAGAGQPATRPESKSEGSQKPQPESEGRSR